MSERDVVIITDYSFKVIIPLVDSKNRGNIMCTFNQWEGDCGIYMILFRCQLPKFLSYFVLDNNMYNLHSIIPFFWFELPWQL